MVRTVMAMLQLLLAACFGGVVLGAEDTPDEKVLLASGVAAEAPSWRADGRTLVVDSVEPPGIVQVNIEDGSATWLSRDAYHNGPTFNPSGGDQVAYADKDAGGLWLRRSAGKPRQVLSGLVEMNPRAWSPDGKWLAVRTREGLLVVDPAGAGSRLLVKPSKRSPLGPSVWGWSPDGRRLLGTTPTGLILVDVQSGDVSPVPDFPASIGIFGPDGTLWGRRRGKESELLRRGPDGGLNRVGLGNDIRWMDANPQTGVLAVSVAQKGIALVEPESMAVRWVAEGGDPLALSWAPDGSSLAFVRYEHGKTGLYLIAPQHMQQD